MTHDVQARRELLKDLFLEATDIPTDRRAAFLDTLTVLAGEERQELQCLLSYDRSAERFFDQLSREMGSPSVTAYAFLPDDVVASRFRIRRFIARGGMGEVYEADDLELNDRVALKVLRPALAAERAFLERFRREIRLGRGITNPHICRAYDVFRDETRDSGELVFFTMEILDGETLATVLRRTGPMDFQLAASIVCQMIEGLEVAHRAGVLHRDFKSGNVMLCDAAEALRVVITDFGLARSLDDLDEAMSEMAATPAYAAPEQLSRERQTAAVDVFALGVVMYEMVTGRLPFNGFERHLPVPPRRLRPDLNAAWEKAILRCLAIRPEDRFASVSEVARALSLVPHKTAGLDRRKVLAGAAGVISAASGLAWWRLRPKLAPPVIAIMPFDLGPLAGDDQRQIAGGIADRMADLLSQLPGLRVLSRSASERALRGSKDAFEAAASLRAVQLLTGRLELLGVRARVRFELAQVNTRTVLWSQTADVSTDELEATYRQAVQAVVGVLRLAVPPPSSGVPLTTNARAYENYLKARFLMEQRQYGAAEVGLRLTDEALALDNTFGKAYALRGVILEYLSSRDGADRPRLLAQSREAARAALRADPRCAEALVVLAMNQQYWDWDRPGAESNFRRAIEYSPGIAFTHHAYAKFLYGLERHEEAIREIESAVSLDPLSSTIRVARGYVLLYAGRIDEAITQHREIIASEPGRATGYIPLADSYEMKGDLTHAIEAARVGVRYSKQASFALSQLGHALAAFGRDPEARDILTELEQRYNVGKCKANEVAALYAGWKDEERTLAWLERGIPPRDVELSTLRVSVAYRFVHRAPRFHRLLKTVGLES